MKRVLIVDDEPELVSIVEEILKDIGYSVESANCGKDAVLMMSSREIYDVLITDMRMPNGGGDYLLSHLPTDKAPKLIIVMSGFSDYSREDILRLGAHRVLTKPLKVPELLKTIEG